MALYLSACVPRWRNPVESYVSSNPRWSARYVRLRPLVLERDGHRCQLEYPGCKGHATQVDHITPRRFGGTDTMGNLRASCERCNKRRNDGTVPVSNPVSVW